MTLETEPFTRKKDILDIFFSKSIPNEEMRMVNDKYLEDDYQ